MAIDTVIKNCKVVKPNGIFSAGIAIENGKIALLAPDAYLPSAKRTIDAKGNYVLPGLVDSHTHLAWWPKRSDFVPTVQSETKSFAAGGCTTIVHMLHGGADVLEQVTEYRRAYSTNGYTDIAFSAQIVSLDQVKQFRQVVEAGITAFKFHMPYRVGQPMVKDLPQIDDGVMYLGFEEIARLAKEGHNAYARVHCENIEIFSRLKDRFIEQGIEPSSWTESRPNVVEAEAINRVIFLGEVTGCPVCIIHMSTKDGVDLVSRARREGVNVIAETCPQYLTLNVDNSDILAKVEPPIRHKEDNEKLWEAVREGVVTMIGTDHAPPCPKRSKIERDLWNARLGFPIAEYWLMVLLSEGVNKGRISLEKLVEVSSYNPAEFYGLTPHKGMIEVGADADLVIVDLEKETVSGDTPTYSAYDFNCWAGWRFKGGPVLTMLRGEVIVEEGKILGTSGLGEYVPSRSK